VYKLIVRPLRSQALARLLALCEVVVQQRMPAKVQRMGAQTWQSMLSRWPKLGEFVGILAHGPARPSPARREASERGESQTSPISAAPYLDILADRSAHWPERVEAAHTLGRCEGPAVLAALCDALRDPSAEVAAAAAAALGRQPDSMALEALRAALLNAGAGLHPITRAAAVEGLAARLRGEALRPVLDAVRDQDAEVSIAAIAALAEHAPAHLEGAVLPVLRDNAGYFLPLVRLAAAHALERAGVLQASVAMELASVEADPAVLSVLQRLVQTQANVTPGWVAAHTDKRTYSGA
jgi:HEAT repeat protein